MKSKVILAVGAHPDDIELGCGGTLSSAVKLGNKVIAVFLTKGDMSGDPEVRCKESVDALACLGVNEVCFGDFKDAGIGCSHDVIEFLESFSRETKVEAVLTHTINDIHQDHRNAGWVSLSAFRNIPKILAYETPRVTAAFSPNYFVDISDCVEDKWRALKCHKSQKSKRYVAYESMVNLASFRGAQVNLAAAEAFEVIRYVERNI